jgi:hydrogenase large subunit
VRELIAGSQLVHDHVVHFYHLHALDWVDVQSAMRADPARTAQLATSVSNYPSAGVSDFRAVLGRLQALGGSTHLSLFTSGFWGHPAYRLSPEENLLIVSHYLDALEWQRDVIRIHAVLGGRNPHPQTFLVGGMAVPIDPNSPQAINPERITLLHQLISSMRRFVERVYMPDVLLITRAYPEWLKIGGNTRNFLTYGDHSFSSTNTASFVFPRGIVADRELSRVLPVDERKITEEVTRSWYRNSRAAHAAVPPAAGETEPNYTGPKPPYEWLQTDRKYSWLKAPRYNGEVMEVGPLARTLVALAAGVPEVRRGVDGVLRAVGATTGELYSTLGRVLARALETGLVVDRLDAQLNSLEQNMQSGDLRIADTSRWDPSTWPSEARGFGSHEVPRGALGHWAEVSNGLIKHYQVVAPTTWNASPRDASGQPGPYEQALVGIPVADPARPLELLRTLHSFDPCLACAVHVLDASGVHATAATRITGF